MKKFVVSLISLSFIFSSYAFTEKECKEYVKQVEKCIKNEKTGDLNTKWRKCETEVVTKLIQEQEDQGNCFSFEECRDLVMQEMKSCNKERSELYRKLLQNQN